MRNETHSFLPGEILVGSGGGWGLNRHRVKLTRLREGEGVDTSRSRLKLKTLNPGIISRLWLPRLLSFPAPIWDTPYRSNLAGWQQRCTALVVKMVNSQHLSWAPPSADASPTHSNLTPNISGVGCLKFSFPEASRASFGVERLRSSLIPRRKASEVTECRASGLSVSATAEAAAVNTPSEGGTDLQISSWHPGLRWSLLGQGEPPNAHQAEAQRKPHKLSPSVAQANRASRAHEDRRYCVVRNTTWLTTMSFIISFTLCSS